jgi:uncharacterized protein
MKYLLLLVVLAVAFYLLGQRRRPPAPPPATPPAPPPPRAIVSCAHCGLHLPQDEALPGRGGLFCCAEHRAAFEAAPPRS